MLEVASERSLELVMRLDAREEERLLEPVSLVEGALKELGGAREDFGSVNELGGSRAERR